MCVGMLWTVLSSLRNCDVPYIKSSVLYLGKSDLENFLSILNDTTLATSNRGQNEQLLDVFYGALVVCMIRYVLSLTFRYSTPQYEPLHSNVNPDPTFPDGPKSQLYEPMLLLLESSMSTFQGGNSHFMRAAAASAASAFDDGGPPLQSSMSMYNHAVCFIRRFTKFDLLVD